MIVDDEENARKNIGEFLSAKKYELILCESFAQARSSLLKGEADLVLLDVLLPDGYGPNLLYDIAKMPYRPPCIIITAYGDIDMAVTAMRNGALDFISKPIEFERLEQSINKAVEIVLMRRELAHLRKVQQEELQFVPGSSAGFHDVMQQAKRAAKASASVLITGETGTGKEIVAKFIHAQGPRASKPIVPVNCAAIQPTMLESELFGFEAGAFTGADRRKIGFMELADEGILFLDEISSMPVDTQVKLLRAIESRKFFRVGGVKEVNVDVQILAASNRNLKHMIEEGTFRQDLYYRLKVVDIEIPPLRDRVEDIPELVGFFVRKFNMQMGLNVTDISPLALQSLMAYSWPGNVRELSNAIERAMLFCDDAVLDLVHLPSDVLTKRQ
jgi:DNA-binding NtrC family response regulator